MEKKNRELVKLLSSEGTGLFYITSRNKKVSKEKLKTKKYDRKVRKHVFFYETKLK